jgi:hypothetical protein
LLWLLLLCYVVAIVMVLAPKVAANLQQLLR